MKLGDIVEQVYMDVDGLTREQAHERMVNTCKKWPNVTAMLQREIPPEEAEAVLAEQKRLQKEMRAEFIRDREKMLAEAKRTANEMNQLN